MRAAAPGWSSGMSVPPNSVARAAACATWLHGGYTFWRLHAVVTELGRERSFAHLLGRPIVHVEVAHLHLLQRVARGARRAAAAHHERRQLLRLGGQPTRLEGVDEQVADANPVGVAAGG